MRSLLFHRILAGLFDYLLVILFASGLLGLTLLIQSTAGLNIEISHPLLGQVVGFTSLTLPVFLYFYLSEKGRLSATLGKKIFNLRIAPKGGNIFKRNLFKFLPWEVAHTGVHWLIYFDNLAEVIPIWVYILLIFPQIVVLIYFLFILVSKGKQSLYDHWSGTSLEKLKSG